MNPALDAPEAVAMEKMRIGRRRISDVIAGHAQEPVSIRNHDLKSVTFDTIRAANLVHKRPPDLQKKVKNERRVVGNKEGCSALVLLI